ncbi:hypothetical protein MIR68_005474 [Amoeboaphelidium protococcarum]|nr:hypothetical protein MIR68_005474 [Amoeboaphelidium protococcarum]
MPRCFAIVRTLLVALILGLVVYLQFEQMTGESPRQVRMPQFNRNTDNIDTGQQLRQSVANHDDSAGMLGDIQPNDSDDQRRYLFNITGKYIEFPHPTCPPHPILKEPSIPYDYIPYTARELQKTVCGPSSASSSLSSKVRLYPGKVIVIENAILDFNLRFLQGSHSVLQQGFLTIHDCELVDTKIEDVQLEYVSRSIKLEDAPVSKEDYDIEETDDTVIIGRDDCGNTWHALADVLRVWNAALTVDNPESLTFSRKVLVVDDRLQISEDPDTIDGCPYKGTLDAIGRKGVLRGKDFVGKRVLFKRLIIPADEHNTLGLIWSMTSCSAGELIGQYVNNLFDYFGFNSLNKILLDGANQDRINQEVVHITFSSRRKKPFAPVNARIGRVLQNEAELIKAIEAITGVVVKVAEFFELEFKDQLSLMRQTDILIGMHGAGLTNLIYTALDGYVIELIPFTWESPEYFNLATMTGRHYLRWRNTKKSNHIESECHELQGKNSIDGPNICRTGTSTTIAEIDEILPLVKEAVEGVKESRRQGK